LLLRETKTASRLHAHITPFGNQPFEQESM
jgi:hypothetical protein